MMLSILIIFSFPLFSNIWTVGVWDFSEHPASLDAAAELSALMAPLFTEKKTFTQAEYNWISQQVAIQAQKTTGKALHEAYRTESEQTIKAAHDAWEQSAFVSSFPSSLQTEIKVFSNAVFDDAVKEGNIDILSHLCNSEGLDAVVIPTYSILYGLIRTVIQIYEPAEQTLTTVFDEYVLLQDREHLEIRIVEALIPHFLGDEVVAITVTDSVPGLTFSSDKGVLQTGTITSGTILFLPEIPQTLTLAAYGYENETFWISPEEESIVLSGVLERAYFGPLSVISATGTVKWYSDGFLQTEPLPILINDQTLPLSLSASKTGFQTQAFQNSTPQSFITIDLQPAWLSEKFMESEGRNKFYRSMGRTLLLAGAMIAANTITQVTDGPTYQRNPIHVVTTGALVLSAIDLVANIFSYYNYASYQPKSR